MTAELNSVLRRVRLAADLSTEDLAGLLGTDAAAVDTWERGDLPVPEEIAEIFAGIPEPVGLVERVGAELKIAAELRKGTDREMARLRGGRFQETIANQRAFMRVDDPTEPLLREYDLLQRQAYGRLIRLRDQDTGRESVYRVAFGEQGWPDLAIYSRNALLIARLMSARPGEPVEIRLAGRERTFEVLEVSLLFRHRDDELSANLDNFERAEVTLGAGASTPARVEDLRGWFARFVQRLRDGLRDRVRPEPDVIDEPEFAALVQESRAALSDRFFMDPLADQEQAMRWSPRGHVMVEGVAGSGKTSVALGRAAMLKMKSEDAAGPSPFRPETGVGFVLSEQLVGYLAGILRSPRLDLARMPVQSYFALRQGLITDRQIMAPGILRGAPESVAQDPVVGSAAWAQAAEELMARRIVAALLEDLPTEPQRLLANPSREVTPRHWDVLLNADPRSGLSNPWETFRRAVPGALGVRTSSDPTLDGALERLDAVRANFANRLEKLSPWDSPKLRDDRRRISQRLRDAIAKAFGYAARYFDVVADPAFEATVLRHLGEDALSGLDVAAAVANVRARGATRTLSNADIDVLLLLAHRAAVGYRGRDGAQPIHALRELPHRTHVFIDEVQDFSEVQVRLMAAQADPQYHCVTAVGDFAQRLTRGGIASTRRSGLTLVTDEGPFLARNMRQSAPLHALSAAFRERVQGDRRPVQGRPPTPEDERPFLLGSGEDAVRDALRSWLIATRERSPHYSMAVLCPEAARAQALERALHDELWSRNILTAATDSQTDAARLCESYFVHFTTPLQSKGLEFDAVFALDVDRYDLTSPSAQGALYVALSRPRRRLGIGVLEALPAPLTELFREHLSPAPGLA